MRCTCWLAWGMAVFAAGVAGAAEDGALPAEWVARWEKPPLEDRPLQIVHGIDPKRAVPEGISQMIREDGPAKVRSNGMRFYLDRGLGGIVCNVNFKDYMRSDEHWKTLAAGVEACRELGMVVWLYDEDGYPSGAAGGLVLEENPALEATELAFDPTRDDPFVIRPAYEHTHASNNYYAARRYANLIDDRATRCFIAKTHGAYWKRLGPYFGRTIRATFTDEPSLVAINIGQIPEDVRKRVRVVDPLDPEVKPLPCVPWCYDLAERYQERFGEDLMPVRRSLFEGDSSADRKVRRQFWSLVADVVAERYFGAIQEWCGAHGVASSGHSLHEESIMHHVALNGNSLEDLGRMDIPGLDMLTSDPQAVIHSGWLTAGLPSSAAILNGTRRVMTEVSDFAQKMGGAGPAGLAEMQATAAWQAAWGVTDFTLYYGIADRSVDDYQAYCDYVGRLNAILKPAEYDRRVLLYYPIRDLWEEYLPVAEPLRLDSQSPRAQQIVRSFMRLGQTLQRSQIPFALVGYEKLGKRGNLSMGPGEKHREFDTLVLPDGVEVPPDARKRFGWVFVDKPDEPQMNAKRLIWATRPCHRISPPSDRIVLGQFMRDERAVLLMVNVGREPYEGELASDKVKGWHRMDPATGEIEPLAADDAGRSPLKLAPRQAVLLVQAQ